MFRSATRKTVIRLYLAAAALAGLGMAARAGEDGMLGSTNVVSSWVFGIAAITLYYALLVTFILWRRSRRSDQGQSGQGRL